MCWSSKKVANSRSENKSALQNANPQVRPTAERVSQFDMPFNSEDSGSKIEQSIQQHYKNQYHSSLFQISTV